MVKVRKPVWVKGKRLGVKKTLPLPLNQTGLLTLTLLSKQIKKLFLQIVITDNTLFIIY